MRNCMLQQQLKRLWKWRDSLLFSSYKVAILCWVAKCSSSSVLFLPPIEQVKVRNSSGAEPILEHLTRNSNATRATYNGLAVENMKLNAVSELKLCLIWSVLYYSGSGSHIAWRIFRGPSWPAATGCHTAVTRLSNPPADHDLLHQTRNTTIPTKQTQTLNSYVANQTSVLIKGNYVVGYRLQTPHTVNSTVQQLTPEPIKICH